MKRMLQWAQLITTVEEVLNLELQIIPFHALILGFELFCKHILLVYMVEDAY